MIGKRHGVACLGKAFYDCAANTAAAARDKCGFHKKVLSGFCKLYTDL
jgi:hypothetical protein